MLSQKTKRELRELLIIFLAWGSIMCFIGQPCYVPSTSMRDELLVGDVVLLNKLCYPGPRIPRILAIPFTEKTIWGTSIPSYIPFPILPYIRLRFLGFFSLNRGDVFVFNTPSETAYPTEIRQRYVKQLKALPGDTIAIVEGTVYINGEPEPPSHTKSVMFRYFVKTKQTVPSRFFDQYTINSDDVAYAQGGFYLYATQETLDSIAQNPLVETIEKAPPVEYLYNMPTITVPAKGMTILMDAQACRLYGETIQHYEGHRDVQIKGDVLFIDGEEVENYTFRQNYYFAMGKNFFRSSDSRFWGFVPEDHIEGKVTFIILGARPGVASGDQWYRKLWILSLARGQFTWSRSFTFI